MEEHEEDEEEDEEDVWRNFVLKMLEEWKKKGVSDD